MIKMKLNLRTYYFLLLTVFLSSACQVKWITDYDAKMIDTVVTAAQHVDAYYADLIALTDSSGEIQFTETKSLNDFNSRYQKIDTELYGIMLKNKSKSLNKFSADISKSILENYWRKYKGDLDTKVGLLQLHRKYFTQNFEALIKAENAKNTSDNE
jgi:hypothetical protein